MKQSNPCPNYKTAYFWSNAVCEPGDEAAAISFNPSPSIDGLVILNFSDFLEPNDLLMGTKLKITYNDSEVDPTAFLSGLLCGPLIVLPTVNASCLEID
jgi:hypothetical protein